MKFGPSGAWGDDAVRNKLDEESSHTAIRGVDCGILQSSCRVGSPIVDCSWWWGRWSGFGDLCWVLKSGELEELVRGDLGIGGSMPTLHLGSLDGGRKAVLCTRMY
jgi:hypothetical protein